MRSGVSPDTPTLRTIRGRHANGPPTTFVAQYAVLYRAKGVEIVVFRLQLAVDELKECFDIWRINISPKKTEAVLFKRKRKPSTRRTITINWGIYPMKAGGKVSWSRSG